MRESPGQPGCLQTCSGPAKKTQQSEVLHQPRVPPALTNYPAPVLAAADDLPRSLLRTKLLANKVTFSLWNNSHPGPGERLSGVPGCCCSKTSAAARTTGTCILPGFTEEKGSVWGEPEPRAQVTTNPQLRDGKMQATKTQTLQAQTRRPFPKAIVFWSVFWWKLVHRS